MDLAAASDAGIAPSLQEDDGKAELSSDDDGNNFQKAVLAWRNINLSKLIPTLDAAASDLVTHQRDTLVERKELAQKTKEFRKLEDSAKLAEVKSLLKSYQAYIDLVTNQSKTASSSFLQLYSSLSEAPDPYPLLEATVDSLVIAEETLPRIQEENSRLQSSVLKLTKQLDETESRLQNERLSRQSLEQTRESNAKEIEASWAAVLEEKEDNWHSKERSLEEKVESQDRLLKELKASYEVSQRLERGGAGDDTHRGVVSAAELEILNSDLEKVNSRLAEVEARNEQLRLQLAQSTTKMEKLSTPGVDDDPAFLRLRSENSSLLRKAEAARLEKDAHLREWETNSRGLNREIATLKNDCDSLRAKVEKWGDYEDVKRELEVLKSIEFSTGDDDDFGDQDNTSNGISLNQNEIVGSDSKQNLERLLLARNKKLNEELTILRVSHQDLVNRLETLQEDLSSANMELEKSRSLTVTLENDLARVQQPNSPAAMSVAGTYTSKYPSSSHQPRKGRVSPTSSIISGFESMPIRSLDSLRAGEPVGGGSGILPMITAQRDRFKKRIAELESELSKTYQNVSSLRSEIASLQKDNLNLYEKTRYVSTYNRGPPATSSASSYAVSPNPSSIDIAGGNGNPLDRYRSAYESKISPFAAFRGRESARIFKRMSLPERFVYQITRLILATRTSRNLFAIYCLALHLLMFFMLYSASTGDIEKHTSHLADATTQFVGSAGAAMAAGEAPEDDDWQQAGFPGG